MRKHRLYFRFNHFDVLQNNVKCNHFDLVFIFTAWFKKRHLRIERIDVDERKERKRRADEAAKKREEEIKLAAEKERERIKLAQQKWDKYAQNRPQKGMY